jgi:hypothetical protein
VGISELGGISAFTAYKNVISDVILDFSVAVGDIALNE